MAGDGQRGPINLGAMTLGVTALIGVLGTFTLSGTVN